MSDLPPTDPATSADPPPPSRMDSAAERAVAKAEAAATSRLWITLAEALAIAGVAFAALTLWTNWSDRRDEDTARKAERADTDRRGGWKGKRVPGSDECGRHR